MFRLTSFTNVIRFANVQQWPIVITLTVPAPASLTKYAMRAGLSSISPSAWTIRFLDVNGIEVGRDTRTRETFASEQSREFHIVATSVRKAILTIDKVPTIVRSTTGYFINSQGLFEQAPVNGARYQFNPVTLTPTIIEEQRTNMLWQSNNMLDSIWLKSGATLTASSDFPLYAGGGNVYYLKANGANSNHNTSRLFIYQLNSLRTLSVYLRQHTAT